MEQRAKRIEAEITVQIEEATRDIEHIEDLESLWIDIGGEG